MAAKHWDKAPISCFKLLYCTKAFRCDIHTNIPFAGKNRPVGGVAHV